ncbi:MAG: hypothetical protein KTR15_04535 [Phycisphaeraceae bacterium]|nr:hypothetical protein [Phycisphaeraceae bacterium]
MQNRALNINDDDTSTAGGPPGWLAFSVIMSSYFVVLMGVVAYCVVLP